VVKKWLPGQLGDLGGHYLAVRQCLEYDADLDRRP
jgi:hypothetical protein